MKCRPGNHFVKAHLRVSANGVKHKVESHCRQNPKSKASFLYKSNLDYIFDEFKNRYKYEKLKSIKGYPQDKGQYDHLIQFWLHYWKAQRLISDDIDPLLVKAIIAVESSFRESIITKMPNSTATGLMQLLVSTMKVLAQKNGKEVRKANIDISQEEALEANTNIAAGTRWLIFKITTSPGRNLKLKKDRLFAGVKYYHSWNQEGEEYAKKIFELYEKSQ